ncbi:MAG: hydrolase [Longimicrobiales bacterium]|nr:hydrolase [Longimicrobiales bacterium]
MLDPPPPDPIPAAALPPTFRPARMAANPHVQTLAGRFLRPDPRTATRRERWDTPDGDFLDLDIAPPPHPDAPVCLILHGLEGNSDRRYVRCAVDALTRRGLGVVAMNFRSCSGEPNRRARSYHSGETGDLRFVVARLAARHPEAPLAALGFSLGGNVLLKYLAEEGYATPVSAAAVISVPFDLAAGAALLERTRMGRIYTRYFLRSLIAKVEEKVHLVSESVDLERIRAASSIREFDDAFTAPLHGFRDALHYYAESSSGPRLPEVRIPTLVVHAQDDPFLPFDAVPVRALRDNPILHPVLTRRGGHVGFLRGTLQRPGVWAEEAAARFLDVILSDP